MKKALLMLIAVFLLVPTVSFAASGSGYFEGSYWNYSTNCDSSTGWGATGIGSGNYYAYVEVTLEYLINGLPNTKFGTHSAIQEAYRSLVAPNHQVTRTLSTHRVTNRYTNASETKYLMQSR